MCPPPISLNPDHPIICGRRLTPTDDDDRGWRSSGGHREHSFRRVLMSDDQPSVESTPTPSIKSLKNKFEQLAQESSKTAGPLPAPSKPNSTASSLFPQVYSPLPQDDQSSSSITPHRLLRSASSNSDLNSGQKRAPPPPPPSRSTKKSTSSLAASPLLRPVPVPAHASPDRFPAPKVRHGSEDGNPRGGGVASLRERFA